MGGLLSSEADVFKGCCCDVKLVIIASKNAEHLLTESFGASGRGLHEKISSAEGLDADTRRRLRKIATIRNKLIHEVGYDEVDDPVRFKAEFHTVVETLKRLAKERSGDTSNCVVC